MKYNWASRAELRKNVRRFRWLTHSELNLTQWPFSGQQSVSIRDRAVAIQNAEEGFMQSHFPQTTDLILEGCDRHFVFYNLTLRKFPKLERVYLLSPPSESSVIRLLWCENPDLRVYTGETFYQKYYGRWWDGDTPYVKCLRAGDWFDFSRECETADFARRRRFCDRLSWLRRLCSKKKV